MYLSTYRPIYMYIPACLPTCLPACLTTLPNNLPTASQEIMSNDLEHLQQMSNLLKIRHGKGCRTESSASSVGRTRTQKPFSCIINTQGFLIDISIAKQRLIHGRLKAIDLQTMRC